MPKSGAYKKIVYPLLGFTLLLFSLNTNGQSTGEWIGAQFELDLPKSFTAGIEGEARYYNIGGIFTNKYLIDVGLDYKIDSRWDLSATYRFSQVREENNYYYARHRVSFDIDYDNSFGRLGYSYRNRLQREYRKYKEDAFDAIPEDEWRHKIQLTFDLKNNPMEPYLEHEIFLPLNRHIPFRLTQRRWTTGIEYPLSNVHEIDIGIMYEKELYPEVFRSFVLLFSYAYSIN